MQHRLSSSSRSRDRRRIAALALLLAAFGWATAALGLQDDPAAQRLFLEGQRKVQQGDLAGALQEFDLLVQQFPDSRLAQEALLQSARLLHGQGNAVEAVDRTRRLIELYPRSPRAASAFILQGEFQIAAATSTDDLEEARATVRRVPLLFGREAYPRLEARAEARVRFGEVSFLLGADDEAAGAFLEAIEDETPSVWTARARWGLATVLLWRGQWTAAAEILQRVVNAAADPTLPEADAQTAAAARRRLTLVHRLYLRPQSKQPSWTAARPLTVSGLTLKKPVGVAASEDGRLVVIDAAGQSVVVVSADGKIEGRGSYRNPGRPWFHSDFLSYAPHRSAQPYVPTQGGIELPLERTQQGFALVAQDKQKPLDKLYAGERDPFGKWFLLDRSQPGPVVFDADQTYLNTSSDNQELVDVARDGRGRLLMLDRRDKRVVRFKIDGSRDTTFSRPWKRPQALTTDVLGNFYVLEGSTSTVEVYRPGGELLVSLGPGLPGGVELKSVEDLAVDGSGRLFIADSKLSSVLVVY